MQNKIGIFLQHPYIKTLIESAGSIAGDNVVHSIQFNQQYGSFYSFSKYHQDVVNKLNGAWELYKSNQGAQNE